MKKTVACLAALLALTACIYSEGERVGTVTKFSKKGMFCKTWEGELLQGGMKEVTSLSSDGKSSTTSMAANVWAFTVADEALVPKVKEALVSGKVVKLTYKQDIPVFCSSDTGYFITAVE